MGRKTKIDWCDSTWNPVTGCLHGCEYCYARKIAERFGSRQKPESDAFPVLDGPVRCSQTYEYMRVAGISAGRVQPYPFDFMPTLHRYKLDEPLHWKHSKNIFVCSMADLFGNWVPDEWIHEVFDACNNAPQHRYMFLTKNPARYIDMYKKGIMPKGADAENKWYGTTVTNKDQPWFYMDDNGSRVVHNGFLSIEPILEDLSAKVNLRDWSVQWIIVGAETGGRKDRVIPKREWIEHIRDTCIKSNIPIFMKESLRDMMGNDFVQEFPW